MNIQSSYSYNYNVSMCGKGPKPKKTDKGPWEKFKSKIEQKLIDILPEKTFKEDGKVAKYDKYGRIMARPDANRLIMGITALATQPAIDYYNHRVDDETRTVSRNRTIAKIIACTSVGVLVRGSCYKLVNKMTQPNGLKNFNKWLLPKDITIAPEKLGTYKSAISTIVALVVMIFTNFLLDAPLTAYLTNRFNAKTSKKSKEKEVKNV